MEQKLIETIMTGLTTILVALAGYLTAKGKAYLDKKTILIDQQYGKGESEKLKVLAQDVYYIVEEQYKGVENMANAKRILFDQLLLSKMPGLTQEQLDHLRQSVCGAITAELNKK
jgi:hypothetical protein